VIEDNLRVCLELEELNVEFITVRFAFETNVMFLILCFLTTMLELIIFNVPLFQVDVFRSILFLRQVSFLPLDIFQSSVRGYIHLCSKVRLRSVILKNVVEVAVKF